MTLNQKILFDGDCSFCNFWVRFISKRDKNKLFTFHSLQSEVGVEIRKKHSISESYDSIVLIENDKYYLKSTAALRIVKQLKLPWFLIYGFIIIPKFIRDWVYDLIAKNRHKFFKDLCEIHSEN